MTRRLAEASRSGGTSVLVRARQTPWKAVNEVKRFAWAPFIRAYFAWHGVTWGGGWRLYGAPVIQRHRRSRIVIGRGLEMRNWFASNPLGVTRPCLLATWSAGASIEIGDEVGLTGTTICAATRVTIGHRVLIGANTVIVDTDFHPLDPAVRRVRPGEGATGPVAIEDDCFLGMHVIVLKGSRIGRGAVVGAGSVVSGEVAPGTVVAGNPARVVGQIGAGR